MELNLFIIYIKNMESHVNTYKLNQGGKEYILKISTVGDYIKITCKNIINDKITFARNFTLEEIKRLDQSFATITNQQEALDLLDSALKVQKVSVYEEGDLLKLNFFVATKTENKEISLGEFQTQNIEQTTVNYEETFNQQEAYEEQPMVDYNTNINTGYDTTQYTEGAYDTTNAYTTDETAQYTATGVEEYPVTQDYTQNIQEYTGAVEDTTNQYQTYDTANEVQYNIEDNNQYMQTYQETTETVETTNAYSQPYIAPADDIAPIETATTTTTTDFSNERIDKLAGDTKALKNEHELLQNKINELTGEVNSYKLKIESMQNEKSSNEINALREENRALKQQLLELNKLRNIAAEARVLRSQLAELDSLRRKAAEVDALKAQLKELPILRAKVAELSGAKAQVGELESLRAKVQQMNLMKQQLGELESLRAKVAELNNVQSQLRELEALRSQVGQINILKQQIEELTKLKNDDDDNLRKKIRELEDIKLQYEQEIRNLRETNYRAVDESKTVKLTETKMRNIGMDSKQIFFEDKPQQICVKGDIIHNTDELELVTRKMNKSNQKITLNLLYKATADSDKAEAFHAKCDEARSTLVLIETDKGKRFGGYTACSWSGDCINKNDPESFIFSFDKMQTYENIQGEEAIGCYPKFGPIFLGCQIRIYDDAFEKGGTTFEKGLNYNTEEDYELTGGEKEFNVREIEVYEVIAQ